MCLSGGDVQHWLLSESEDKGEKKTRKGVLRGATQ